MLELIRKDVGQCRNVLFGCLIALFAPYVAAVSNTLSTSGLTPGQTFEHFCLGLLQAAVWGFLLSIVSVAFLAGFIVAGERRDRSAEFLAFLPPTKWMVISSKAIVCFGWVVIVAIVLLFTVLFVTTVSDGEHWHRESRGDSLLPFLSAGLPVFGIAWLLSCCIESPVFAILAGLAAPMVIVSGIYLIEHWTGLEFGMSDYNWTYIAIGFTSFLGGVWHFISRVEP